MKRQTSIRAAEEEIRQKIQSRFGERESKAIARWLLHYLRGNQYFLKAEEILSDKEMTFLNRAIERLKAGEPVQYITGETEFFGLNLKVSSDVLIPRPETEELVRVILDHIPGKSPSVWDIGTGSGAIALALKSAMPDASVFASDFSAAALKIARENAENLGLDVSFFTHDILTDPLPDLSPLDIIVSNPPYIPFSEADLLASHVLQHEPEIALFVPDEDPLVFYREISRAAEKLLADHGQLFFEIHEDFAQNLQSLLESGNFSKIRIHKDLQGKNRMISAGIKR